MTLPTLTTSQRCTVQPIPPSARVRSAHEQVRRGLTSQPKSLPSILFYDEKGSRLFEAICQLPEYYLTRTELAILRRHASEMASRCDPKLLLVELGNGSSSKTRLLLDALFARDCQPVYRPVAISESMLRATAQELAGEYSRLQVQAIASDYTRGLQEVQTQRHSQKVFLFLGSNLGNFEASEAVTFLRKIRRAMAPGDFLLLGVDLIKPLSILLAAYDDTRGVTAAFNRNILAHINRELQANFVPELFHHHVKWNDHNQAVEMYLGSQEDQGVYIKDLDLVVEFKEGETIHTESSHKYTLSALSRLCTQADLQLKTSWTDEREWFAVNLILPGPPASRL